MIKLGAEEHVSIEGQAIGDAKAREVLVDVRGVTKAYRMRHPTMRSAIASVFGRKRAVRPALEDVDFRVHRGEAVGIVGRNGSGKSTLLRLIAGTLAPSGGSVEVRGRLGSLLDLGSGISPEYTGAENARLLGLLSGLSRRQADARVEDVRTFSGLGEAFDRPASSYSSGMLMRLGFSASVHGDPDLLLIDEALAVGDAFFQQRCLRRLREMRDAGVTVVLVSHDPSAIISLCTRCLWVESGRVVADGAPDEVVRRFLAARYADACELDDGALVQGGLADPEVVGVRPAVGFGAEDALDRFGDQRARILGLDARDTTGASVRTVRPGEAIDLVLTVRAEEAMARPLVGVTLRNRLGDVITATNSELEGRSLPPLSAGQELEVVFRFVWPPLTSGPVSISPAIAEGTVETHRMADWVENAWIVECVNPRGLVGWWALDDVAVEVGALRTSEGAFEGCSDDSEEPVGTGPETPPVAFALERPASNVVEQAEITEGRALFFSGWCFSPDCPDVEVEIEMEGEIVSRAEACHFREDVASVHEAVPHAGRSGFGLLAKLPETAGEIDVTLRAVLADGRSVSLETRSLSLPPPRSPLETSPRVAPLRALPAGRPKRVVFVSHGLAFEGAPIALLDLARSLDPARVEALGLSPAAGGLEAAWKEAGIPMEIMPVDRWSGGADDYEARVRRLAAMMALRRPDLIVANTLETFWAVHVARELGIPAVWFVHESEEPDCYFHSRLSTAIADQALDALSTADATVFVADATRALFETHLSADRAHVIPNGLLVDRFAVGDRDAVRAERRRSIGLTKEHSLVLCAGTTCMRKGQLELVRAWAQLPDASNAAHLVLLGVVEGPYLDRIRETIEREGLGGRVSLLPHVDDPRDWFAAADVVACPSFQESLPRVVQEGMASGVPILATDVFGIPELVRDGQEGLLVRAGDVEGLANALAFLIGDPEAARRMGEAGRARIRAEFSQRLAAVRHTELIEGVLEYRGAQGSAA